jgi:hypothetical protein
MFMSYESLRELSSANAGAGADIRISCYEIVMPDPITGFALKVMTDTFPEKDAHIIENNSRYTLGNTFRAIGTFGERSLRVDGMVYPYWENAARYTEDWLALLLVLSLALIVCPAICGVLYGTKAIIVIVKHGKGAVSKIIEEHDERAAEKYLLDNDGEQEL